MMAQTQLLTESTSGGPFHLVVLDSIVTGESIWLHVQVRPPLPAENKDRQPRITAAEHRVLVEPCRPVLDGVFPVPAGNRDIAANLCLSVAGVKSHIRSLFDKFGVHDLPQNRKRAELAHRAIRQGDVARNDL